MIPTTSKIKGGPSHSIVVKIVQYIGGQYKVNREIRTWSFWRSFRPLLHHTSSAHHCHSAPELISLLNCITSWGKASSGAI